MVPKDDIPFGSSDVEFPLLAMNWNGYRDYR